MGNYRTTPGTSASTLTTLPIEQRHWPIQYANDEGTVGVQAIPINYTELYNLKGRLLTLVDATFTDPEQRKAHKTMVWHTLQDWMRDLENGAGTDAERNGALHAKAREAQQN
jgi:hypothetical protein